MTAASQSASAASPSIHSESIDHLADLFRLMGDGTRLRIVLICLRAATNVSDIATELGVSQSLVSHHLRLLRAARVLRADRRGKQIFYSAQDAHIESVIADMVAHVDEPADELS